jgi:hypothetical protein
MKERANKKTPIVRVERQRGKKREIEIYREEDMNPSRHTRGGHVLVE